VDADLRRSAVHNVLKIARSPGLSDLIRNKVDIQSAIKPWKKNKFLKVIAAGLKPPNITEVVGTRKISSILSKLKEEYDLIIIDAPPLIIADTYNLAASADGVIIVLEPGQTSDEQAKTMKEQLDRVNANILGFVFNKVSEETEHSYGGFQYRSLYSSKYYGEYSTSATREPATVSRSKKLIDFFEHGKMPTDTTTDVENAIAAIKTQPKNVFRWFRRDKVKEKE
jgi:capsular exopolysaccharide synthesis family protein